MQTSKEKPKTQRAIGSKDPAEQSKREKAFKRNDQQIKHRRRKKLNLADGALLIEDRKMIGKKRSWKDLLKSSHFVRTKFRESSRGDLDVRGNVNILIDEGKKLGNLK